MNKNTEATEFNGILTQPMDVGSEEFKTFQAILLNHAKTQSNRQRKEIELMALKLQMKAYLEAAEAPTQLAGEFLKTCLKTLQIRQNKFASYIGIRPSNLSKLLKGERPINHELALILDQLFNIDAELWLEIQDKNELEKLRRSDKSSYQQYNLDDLLP